MHGGGAPLEDRRIEKAVEEIRGGGFLSKKIKTLIDAQESNQGTAKKAKAVEQNPRAVPENQARGAFVNCQIGQIDPPLSP